ncbi:hypothetical protein Ancab_024391 [Ancistrocladus abbreviatus]
MRVAPNLKQKLFSLGCASFEELKGDKLFEGLHIFPCFVWGWGLLVSLPPCPSLICLFCFPLSPLGHTGGFSQVQIHVAEPRIVFLAVELENAIPQLRCWLDVLMTLSRTTVLSF